MEGAKVEETRSILIGFRVIGVFANYFQPWVSISVDVCVEITKENIDVILGMSQWIFPRLL